MKLKHIFYCAVLPFALLQLSGTNEYDYQKLGYTQKGKASYYGTKFHGRPTASGEKYNMYDATAAHKKILFNSLVEVTNKNNGKTAIVRVNDRGPFKPGRIIDLSYATAKKLDMVRDGVVNIEIRLLRAGADGTTLSPKGSESKTKRRKPRRKVNIKKAQKKNKYLPRIYSIWGTQKYPEAFGVQIGSYKDLKNAVQKGKDSMAAGFDEVYIRVTWTADRSQRLFRVSVGDMNATQARDFAKKLDKKGFRGCFPKAHFND
ncbi:septal ring lytic transglycosylase RlpA family protein [Bernardetia sp. ABR2-2B]|uniref:septal ring lytic transglycosylase RlpA family protein n=1 Tax=Bernardetia sp. ABR2-2B TaxID=3127472 RepID=UPI0030CC3932